MVSQLPPEYEQLLIVGYVLGNLSSAEAMLVEELLVDNPNLIQQITEVQEALELGFAFPEVDPPPSLKNTILTAYETKSSQPKLEAIALPAIPPKVPKPQTPWVKIWAAIATAIVAGLGIANYRLWQTVKTANITNTQSDRLVYLLRGENLDRSATAKLIVNRDRLNATLTVEDLPPLPPEKAYALWTVIGKDVPYTTDEKGAILTAVFQVDGSGEFTREIAVPQPYLEPRTIKKVAITVEDVSAPQAHQGSIFISTGN